jgi:beta-mannosidase
MELSSGTLFRCAPGAATTPQQVLASATLGPLPITVPSTVAAACTEAGVWSIENPGFALDEFDWWVQVSLIAAQGNPDVSRLAAAPQDPLIAGRSDDTIGSGDRQVLPSSPPVLTASNSVFRSEGLATLSELWWNNELVTTSRSMFVPVSASVPLSLRHLLLASADDTNKKTNQETNRETNRETKNDDPSLWLCFRSVSEHLRVSTNRRDRPAWKSRLVDHQGLRRMRTSLLGRMPGWSPPVPAIGPYRPIRLSMTNDWRDCANLVHLSILSTVTTSSPPNTGFGSTTTEPRDKKEVQATPKGNLDFSVQAPPGVVAATLQIHYPVVEGRVDTSSGDRSIDDPNPPGPLLEINATCTLSGDAMSVTISASGILDGVALWWPHTHGDPWLYPLSIVLRDSNGSHAVHHLEPIGFRTVTVDTRTSSGSNDGFGIVINGVAVYTRGACWTPVDIVSLNPAPALLDDTLDTVVASGMNMVRVGGTMTYEMDRFHRRCDELGIMVWQDFMFANLDVPLDDETLLDDIRAEISHHAQRLGRHASTVVVCGGSEVDQQAAMMGIPTEQWNAGLARSVIEPLCAQIIPTIPFVVSSPSAQTSSQTSAQTVTSERTAAQTTHGSSSAALPFHVDSGVGHYYGVGAYLRGFDDARRANVRFAAECLALANVPENATLDALFADNGRAPHQPLWKQRVPRDNGAGWDFDDVRDHYLKELFGVDPMRLRYSDLERWLDLARMTSAEVLDTVASEWRRNDSTCTGSLVWFLRDLWTGAGWGLIDALGRPKPALAGLARRWQPIALTLTDEGINGLDAHLVNDTPFPIAGALEAVIVRDGVTIVERGERSVSVAARSTQRIRVDELFHGFRDLTWAYRFGPPIGELVRVRFQSEGDETSDPIVRDAHHWVAGRPTAIETTIGLAVQGQAMQGTDIFRITVSTEKTAFGVHLDGEDLRSSDTWFHLAAGDQRVLTVRRPRMVANTPNSSSEEPQPRIVVRALNSRASARLTW